MDFDAVYKDLFKPVFAYILLRVQDRNLAEELAAQTWQKVFDKQNTFNEQKGNIRQWLFTIARNKINSYYRMYYVKKVLSLSDFEEDFTDTSKSAQDTLENEELHQKLKDAMGKLKSNYRDIIALKFYSELNNEEIAKIMHISQTNAGTILNRALNKLKTLLETDYGF